MSVWIDKFPANRLKRSVLRKCSAISGSPGYLVLAIDVVETEKSDTDEEFDKHPSCDMEVMSLLSWVLHDIVSDELS